MQCITLLREAYLRDTVAAKTHLQEILPCFTDHGVIQVTVLIQLSSELCLLVVNGLHVNGLHLLVRMIRSAIHAPID